MTVRQQTLNDHVNVEAVRAFAGHLESNAHSIASYAWPGDPAPGQAAAMTMLTAAAAAVRAAAEAETAHRAEMAASEVHYDWLYSRAAAQPQPAGAPAGGGRDVVVVTPDGKEHAFTVSGEDTAVVLVDGAPVLGVDQHGPGRWHGEQWQRLHPADRVVERTVTIEGITTEDMWLDLQLALHAELGRFKPWAAGQPVTLSADRCNLDAALAWARRHGLACEDQQRVRTDARPGAG